MRRRGLGQTQEQAQLSITVENYMELTIGSIVIESPTPGQQVSGVITVSGWIAAHIDSGQATVDGTPIPWTNQAAVGTTESPFGQAPHPSDPSYPYVSTFAALLDTLQLTDGPHTVAITLTVRPFILQVGGEQPPTNGGGGEVPTEPPAGGGAGDPGQVLSGYARLGRSRHLGAYKFGPQHTVSAEIGVTMPGGGQPPVVTEPSGSNTWLWLVLGGLALWYFTRKK
ncbi:MAG: hypothetical protein L0212_08025 [Acidobacteria bacterium]|nr:hypothetical protein [Acidobacteriota bacterium]